MRRAHTNRLRLVLTLSLMPLLLLATSCVVAVRGTTQGIPFDSNPQGAEVYLDGELMGITPITVELSRGSGHTLVVRLGDQEREVILTNSVDLLGGGLLFVDVVPGGALVISSATEPPCDGSFVDLCKGIRTGFVLAGVASVAVPLAIDLGTGAYYQLSPGEVFIDFEEVEDVQPETEGK